MAGVILPDDLIVPWDDPNEEITEGRTASTSGTSVETISVQSSPPESTVMSPRGEAATSSVRVSNAVPFRQPRERDSSTETINCCLIPTLFPCISRVWIAVTQRTGPTFQEFPELQQMVQAW